ncbi:uncharacterized protein FA14DRAFT_158401 [Meira miltonrushii]|uniref:BZIP domain-containing protein n=1 Tax=Meira miltonrushii TaxID=1280837 RepID=A0A316V2V3_9BASI|nr:uncharacterized protein FA14DRAFT_158401 [Meira miltonrushii]PWN31584.1 hypothetical protein FA14DRAFT_158401 [Meira miltonrushii]
MEVIDNFVDMESESGTLASGSSTPFKDAQEARARRREQTRLAQRRFRARQKCKANLEALKLDVDPSPSWFDPNAKTISLADSVSNALLSHMYVFKTSEAMWAAYLLSNWLNVSKSQSRASAGKAVDTAGMSSCPENSPCDDGMEEARSALSDFIQNTYASYIQSNTSEQAKPIPSRPVLDWFRASLAVGIALGLPNDELAKCKSTSQIKYHWNQRTAKSFPIPPNMHPVEEQFNTPHGLAIDLLPWPETRKKAIVAIKSGVIDHDTFKIDTVFGRDAQRLTCSPFIIHGISKEDVFSFEDFDENDANVAMNPENWECAQTWLEKYWFLVDEETVKQTNYWRSQRGLPPVRIYDVDL